MRMKLEKLNFNVKIKIKEGLKGASKDYLLVLLKRRKQIIV
jgi:hypothetical protein